MLRLFRLGTDGRQLVRADKDHRLLIHAEPDAPDTEDIIALFAPGVAQHCFLIANSEAATPIRCGHPLHNAAALPMRLHVLATDRLVGLVYPVNRKYLCFRPRVEGESFATVWADHDDTGPGREFQLYPVNASGAPDRVLRLGEAIAGLFEAKADSARLLRYLDGLPGDEAGAALGAVLPVFTIGEISALATRLWQEPERITTLASGLSQDIWAREGLPALATWLARRAGATQAAAPEARAGVSLAETTPAGGQPPVRREPARSGWRRLLRGGLAEAAALPVAEPAAIKATAGSFVGREFDALVLPGWQRGFISSAHMLNAALRRRVSPQRCVCIVAPARNEGIYLLEWIAYHRAIGAEAIILYSNDNEDGSDLLLSALAREGVITWLSTKAGPGVPVQSKGYGHALSISPEILDFRWAAFIDLDEFITLEPGLFTSLQDYIAWQELQDADVLALNWMMMRSSSEGALQGLLTERCRQQAGGFDQHVKCLFRPRSFVQTTNHFPLAEDRRENVFRNSRGELHRFGRRTHLDAFEAPSHSDQPDGWMACINHYFFKSAEEFLWKFSRNRGAASEVSQDVHLGLTPTFFEAFMNQLRPDLPGGETPLVAQFGPMRRELGLLLAVPAIAEALVGVQERYAQRLARVKAAYRTAPVLVEAGARGQEFLALAGAI